MPAIGIIDDRQDQRESVVTIFNLCSKDEKWKFVAIEPLPNLADYPSWIVENEVVAIVLDERLHEQVTSSGQAVDYNGHDLAEFIRRGMDTFPLFVVTSWRDDQELLDRQSIVENIIERNDFVGKDRKAHVDRIIRAGTRFSELFSEELAKISELANKVATGKATQQDKEELLAKQTTIKLAFPASELTDREEWINRLNQEIDGFDELRARLEKYMSDKRK